MTDAFILDHVRTPRGRGRPDGSLHHITPIQLAAQTLAAVRDRNALDTRAVDDVVLGCVSPIGEQGADIARVAALVAGFDETVPGKQLNRFCASGLEAVNTAAAQVMSGQSDLTIGGGVESMSRVAMGSDGGAWAIDPAVAWQQYFVPQGVSADLIATLDGYSRERLDAYAVESQRRAGHAQRSGYFDRSVVPVRDIAGEVALARDEYLRPATTLEDLAKLKPAFVQAGEEAGFDAVAIQRYPQIEQIQHVHTAGSSSGIVDGAAAVVRLDRQRADDHADRSCRRESQSAQARADADQRHRPVGDQRGIRGRSSALHGGARSAARPRQRERRCDRARAPARRDRRDDPRHGAR
jgi:acetyl-CoA C-acetyltransferase